jgi:hypothetical protein
MDFRFLYHRIKYFIINPGRAWDVIHRENRPMKYVRGSFFMPLILLVTVSAFVGSMFLTNTTLKPMYSVLVAIATFLELYLAVYVSAIALREIMKALDLGHDFVTAFKLIAYSFSPVYTVLIVSRLFESLLFINVLGLYSIYLFWTGMEIMVSPPEHKKIPMVIATAVVTLAVLLLLQVLLSRLAATVYFAIFA